MNTKQMREKVKQHLSIMVEEVWQDKPYTAISIRVQFGPHFYESYGFAKARWPDKWDADYGVNMARDKAVAKVVKEIMAESCYRRWLNESAPMPSA